MNFSTQFGYHILATTMRLDDVQVDTAEDIDKIVEQSVKDGPYFN